VKFNKFTLIVPALMLILALILGSSLLWRLFIAFRADISGELFVGIIVRARC